MDHVREMASVMAAGVQEGCLLLEGWHWRLVGGTTEDPLGAAGRASYGVDAGALWVVRIAPRPVIRLRRW